MEIFPNVNLVFAENTHIESQRLLLRPITLADAEDMYAYAGDEETTRFVFATHPTVKDTRFAIANYFMTAPLGKYAIELKATGKMIGTIDLRVKAGFATGEIGYALNKEYWGKGIMPEAALEILALGFDKLKLLHIVAMHDLRNPQSGRVMEKIGMKKEGEMKESRLWKGDVIDEAFYGISRSQWQRRVM